MPNASSYFSSLMSRANFFEPVTLVLSPTFTKLVSGRITNGSSPDKRIYGLMCTALLMRLQSIRFQQSAVFWAATFSHDRQYV